MANSKQYLPVLLFCLSFLAGGCAIGISPKPAELKLSQRPPLFRLDRINEEKHGVWKRGGFRNAIADALNQPAAAALFTKDGSGLALQIDVTSDHEDDYPRLIRLGLLSLVTVGIIPLSYHSEWLAKGAVTVRADDGTVYGRYPVQSAGAYDITAYPLTMFTLLGASFRGDSDGDEVLRRTANDIVAQIMTAVTIDYDKLAARYHSPGETKLDQGIAAAPNEGLPVVKSDVDDIPTVKVKPHNKQYAIVIGIERYHQKLPRADFATHDAQTITEYLTKALGYPEENVVTLLNENASNVALAKYFEKWLPNNVEPGSAVFIYFSGHGAPNPKTGDAFLVPYDGDPSFIDETGYSLKRMYTALGKLPAREVVVALDSCFSGAGGRSVLAEGARPLVMNLQSAVALPKNMTVLSAAAGDQTSSAYRDKGHGLFTYFLLKGIKTEDVTRADGSIRLDDLFGYLKPQVERIARKQYNNEQTPQLLAPKQ